MDDPAAADPNVAEGEEKKEEAPEAENTPAPEEGEKKDGEEEGEEEQEEGEGGIGERIAKDPLELSFLVPLPEKIEFSKIP